MNPNARWQEFLDQLPDDVREAVLCSRQGAQVEPQAQPDSEERDYAQFLADLPSELVEVLERQRAVPAPPRDNPRARRLLLVEEHDGELGVLRVFTDPMVLAEHLGQLEGQDVCVWLMYGKHLRLTKGPQRWFELPDGENAISIPMHAGAKINVEPLDTLGELEFQDNGYLGAPELMQSAPLPVTPARLKPRRRVDDDPDDEDDDID